MFRLSAYLLAVLTVVALTGCGTHSHIRPADPLAPGEGEVSAGIGINTFPTFVPVVQGALGISKVFEVGGQFENYSGFGWIRVGILNTRWHKVALAVTVGGGFATLLTGRGTNMFDVQKRGLVGVLTGLTLGRKFRKTEPYLGWRWIYLPTMPGSIHSLKAGTRVYFTDFYMGLEGGADVHSTFLTVPSFALYFGLKV